LEIKSNDIFHTLRELGIASGDLLLVHSSYKSIGSVKDGPAGVVQALMEAVGPDGGCFVPTFNYGELPWQRDQTRSLTGIITETFRQIPGVIRSNHPTHSVAGVGPMAEEVLSGHENINAFGECSPIWRLWKNNAWVLLIGVDHTANSTIHIAEEFLRLPYLNRTRITTVVDDHGERRITLRRPPCSNGFNAVDAPLRARGQIRESRLGNARMLLMRSQDLVAVALELLRDDPAALLCRGGCEFCDESRKKLRTSK
jgi:aminoglycoside 3-N-acetyltransferase